MWTLPISILIATTILAVPLSRYLAWIMNGKYRAPGVLRWFESRLNSGPQNWIQYTASMLIFNTVLFLFGFAVLSLQPFMPLNTLNRGMLEPTTIFHSVVSFMTNTDLQHYSGDQHFSNFSQIFFCLANFFLSASIGFCGLTAIIRAFRSDPHVGNFFVDMWRVVMYMFLPVSLLLGVVFLQQGSPMTYDCAKTVSTLEPGAMGTTDKGEAKPQTIVVGPLAAFVPMKQLGTNGGGFFGMNSAHPFENPTAVTNWLSCIAMMLFPFALVLMYGRMLGRLRHGWVIFSVMMTLMIATIAWSVYFDTLKPNPAFTGNKTAQNYEISDPKADGGKRTLTVPMVPALPVEQHLGNLEGKEMRFGTSAGATFAALTVDVTDGAVNCEHDSLNPVAALSPMVGMWLNCIFGGKGVGMINMLLYIIVGIFVAGQMVGRTPEYLGKKIDRREVALALIALLVHPIMILGPTGLFAATSWGQKATSNPGPHGFSQIMYQFSSASANNGSAFDGLGVTYGANDNTNPSPTAVQFDIATGLVIIISRFLPIIAPIAMAAYLGSKKSAPFGLGTLRDDTPTFGFMLCGVILIVGALLFLPIAALGPLAEHLGPIPFGG
ncbi:MAG TPA: potassium-transporting ATPase subunit KdpA [Pirellulales bacterium]|jgi:K+-transporting ATPase ATPase A chain|nr:potassium-transporting ATPase subunit KdpA [Pirellulales bacterium]